MLVDSAGFRLFSATRQPTNPSAHPSKPHLRHYPGTYWEVFAAVCPNLIEPLVAPVSLNVDREKRQATVRIRGIAESDIKPIKNPATGEEHRARIALPDGFEYKEAEMGNTVNCRVSAGDKLTFQLKNTYAQLNTFDWSN